MTRDERKALNRRYNVQHKWDGPTIIIYTADIPTCSVPGCGCAADEYEMACVDENGERRWDERPFSKNEALA